MRMKLATLRTCLSTHIMPRGQSRTTKRGLNALVNALAKQPNRKEYQPSEHRLQKHQIPQGTPMMMNGQFIHGGADGKRASASSSSCHQCKSRRNFSSLTYCTSRVQRKTKRASCRKKYCDPCLRKFYKEQPPTEGDVVRWTCPSCRNVCLCAACRRRRTGGDIKTSPGKGMDDEEKIDSGEVSNESDEKDDTNTIVSSRRRAASVAAVAAASSSSSVQQSHSTSSMSNTLQPPSHEPHAWRTPVEHQQQPYRPGHLGYGATGGVDHNVAHVGMTRVETVRKRGRVDDDERSRENGGNKKHVGMAGMAGMGSGNLHAELKAKAMQPASATNYVSGAPPSMPPNWKSPQTLPISSPRTSAMLVNDYHRTLNGMPLAHKSPAFTTNNGQPAISPRGQYDAALTEFSLTNHPKSSPKFSPTFSFTSHSPSFALPQQRSANGAVFSPTVLPTAANGSFDARERSFSLNAHARASPTLHHSCDQCASTVDICATQFAIASLPHVQTQLTTIKQSSNDDSEKVRQMSGIMKNEFSKIFPGMNNIVAAPVARKGSTSTTPIPTARVSTPPVQAPFSPKSASSFSPIKSKDKKAVQASSSDSDPDPAMKPVESGSSDAGE